MNKTTVEECSVNATVNGKRAGGFAAEILGDSVVKNSYARRTADKEMIFSVSLPVFPLPFDLM